MKLYQKVKSIYKKVKSIYKEIEINLKYIAKSASIWTGSLVASAQFICFLTDFNDVFPEEWKFFKRVLISLIVVTVVWIFAFVIKSFKTLTGESVEVINAGNNNHVYVEYGDLLEYADERRNVVVTANRCFDTIVDDDLIASNTIHGKAINKICVSGYHEKMLNESLQKDLFERRKINPEMELTLDDKRKGNLMRYPAGTIAEFKKNNSDNITYFFLGMSAFNKDLHAETTDKEYAIVIQSLIEYCNIRSNKIPIYIPIIGTHSLNNKKQERELLEYIVNAFRFNKNLINTDIHIVVYKGRRDEVSIYGL